MILEKTLSKNDTGETGGHQAGFNVLKKDFPVFSEINLGVEKDSFGIEVQDSEGEYFDWNVRWYSSKKEIHVTGCAGFYAKWRVKSGDVIRMEKISGTDYIVGISSSIEASTSEDGRDPEVSSSGVSFAPDAQYRRAVELHAIRRAMDYYSDKGSVEDTSAGSPFDLSISTPSATFTVEVKGTAGNGKSIILTRNEVIHHQEESHSDLFVVRNIDVKRDGDGYTCEGGEVQIISPFNPLPDDLEPLSYKYTGLS